jgi:nucleoside-diphosphate-sugar epimerase
VVVHLAAAVGDPADGPATEAGYKATNVDGTRRLLDAARGRPVTVVSSASVYEPPTGGHPITEAHPVRGQWTAYGRTKAAAERIALGAGAVVLRPRAVYGPGDPYLLPRIRASVRAGLLPMPGPDVRLSLTAVDNLVDACLLAVGWPAGAYNIADAEPYWRDQAVRSVLAAHGRAARIVHVPISLALAAARMARRVSTDPVLTPYAVDQVARGVVLDISKARAQGWCPRRTLADHLADLAEAGSRAGRTTDIPRETSPTGRAVGDRP